MILSVEALDRHDLDGFRCGHRSLDEWLVRSARLATGQGTRTYVLVDEGRRVVGYFAVAPHLLDRNQAPRSIGRGAPEQIPALLLAKLALTESLHGLGLGSELLIRALEHIVRAARQAGGRVVIVDAIDEAATGFYIRHGFQPLPGQAHRLIRRLSGIAETLGQPWP